MSIRLKRIYEPYEKPDGFRILVDRVWPRGIKKENVFIDLWYKEAAPSTILRKWFNHEAGKWPGFLKRYKEELLQSEALNGLEVLIKKHKTVTLLYGAKDEKHNQAVALVQFLHQATQQAL